MAAKQLGFFFCDYCYTTTWLLQLYLTALKSLPRFFFLLNSFASSPFPASLYSTEALRSCLLDQNGCVCRGREKEGMRGRQTEMLGESENFFFFVVGGGRVEMSCSDVTSAAGWQDGKRKLACATQLKTGRIGRHRNGEEIIFLLKHTCNCKTCTS